MIKILFVIGVMICTTSVGWYIRKIMVTRRIYFEDLVKFCCQLKQNIESKKDKISIFVEKNKGSYHKEFCLDIESYFITHDHLQFDYLKENEKREIEQFFSRLGSLTLKEEIDNINAYLIIFQEMQSQSNKTMEKYGNLTLKLSSLIGAIICILLI